MSKSSFDQAFRNQKRYDSTLFLSYIFEEYKEKIKENNISINDMMEAFEKWNKTVESAFSSSNFSIEQTPDLIGKSIDAIGTHTKNK